MQRTRRGSVDLLEPVAERVIVCNVRGKKELLNKNGQMDSDLLSERLRLGSLRGVYHGAASVLALKEMVRTTAIWSRTRRG
jgi:hypothetical protein